MEDIVRNKDVEEFIKGYKKEEREKVIERLCVLGIRKVREINGERKVSVEELEEMSSGWGYRKDDNKKDVNDKERSVKWQQQHCKVCDRCYSRLNNESENNADSYSMVSKPKYIYKAYKTNPVTVEQHCKGINVKPPQLSDLYFNYNSNYTPSNILSPQTPSSLSPHLRYSHLSPSSLSHYKPFYSKYIAS